MPAGRVLIAMNDPALEPNPTWTRIDNTPNLVASIEIRRGRQTEFDQTDTSTATVRLNDTDGLFDPDNALSPYFGLLDGKQIMLQLRNPVTGNWHTQYRGIIDDYGFDFHPSQVIANVQIECVDLFDYLSGVEMIPGLFGDTPPAGSEGTVVYAGTDVQTRIRQLLLDAHVDTDMTVVFQGNVTVLPTGYDPGDSILIALRDAADAEFPTISNLYTDKYGRFVFHGRQAKFDPTGTAASAAFPAWSAVVSYDEGDDVVSAGKSYECVLDNLNHVPPNPTYWREIPGRWEFTHWQAGDGAAIVADPTRAQIRPPLRWSRPRSRIRNAALCYPRSMTDETLIPGQIVLDATSVTEYGYRSWSAPDLIIDEGTTTTNDGAAECYAYGFFIVGNYKIPHTRVEAVTFLAINPTDARAAATWALICGQDISDLLQLEHGYPGGQGISVDFFIEGSEMTITPAAGDSYDMVTLTLNVSPASYYNYSPF